MAEATYQGVVRDGAILLAANVSLPENATVYVVVPDFSSTVGTLDISLPKNQYRVMSPRLSDPKQAARFVMEVRELDSADL